MWKPGLCITLILLASIGMAHGQSWNVVSTVTSTIPSSESVELSCVFDNAWSAATHPIDYPGTDAHWSPMVVAAHSTDYEMWSRNSFASDGVVSVAEVRHANESDLPLEQKDETVVSNTIVLLVSHRLDPHRLSLVKWIPPVTQF